MLELKKLGGIQILGPGADEWKKHAGWKIHGHPVVFDSEVYTPGICSGYFQLPTYRGQYNYTIHLLEDGNVFVMKEGKLYLCTVVDTKPHIIIFTETDSRS